MKISAPAADQAREQLAILSKEEGLDKDLSNIITQILSGKTAMRDAGVFSTRPAVAGKTELFVTGEKKKAGVRNINDAKLDKTQLLFVTRIQLHLAVLSGAFTEALAAIGNFGSIFQVEQFDTGYLTVKQGSRVLVKELPLKLFANSQQSDVPVGVYEMEAPFFFYPNEEIEATVEINSDTAITANTALRIEFDGVGTVQSA